MRRGIEADRVDVANTITLITSDFPSRGGIRLHQHSSLYRSTGLRFSSNKVRDVHFSLF